MPSLECTCGRPFRDEKDLKQHRKARSRYICRRCNKCLPSIASFVEHQTLRATCWENPLKDMLWRCNDCGAVFDSRAASSQHLQVTGHATEFRCCDCNKGFKTENALMAHLEAKDHGTPLAKSGKEKGPKEPKENRECKECNRTFKNGKALKQHQDSVIHRPISNLTCMAGKICGVECNAHFRNPSALVAHMESGTCRSGMDRQKLNRLVLMQDDEHLITSSDGSFESLGWASLENEPESSCSGVMTPSTDSGEGVLLTPLPPLSWQQTALLWKKSSRAAHAITSSHAQDFSLPVNSISRKIWEIQAEYEEIFNTQRACCSHREWEMSRRECGPANSDGVYGREAGGHGNIVQTAKHISRSSASSSTIYVGVHEMNVGSSFDMPLLWISASICRIFKHSFLRSVIGQS